MITGYEVQINPNADKAFFAHELGHIYSDQTKVGNIIRTLRANPKLAAALTGSMIVAPGVAAAVQPGDEDLDEALILSLAAQTPTIADEFLATNSGLGIMKEAGMPATPGQRTRLAGGLLSYLAAPVVAAIGARAAGNFVEDQINNP